MKRRSFVLLVVITVLSIAASACTISAQPPEHSDAEPKAGEPTLPFEVGVEATPTYDIIAGFKTQTAMPANGGDAAVAVPTVALETAPAVTIVVPTEATTSTPTPVVLPTRTRPETYTIQKGEWPICIARRFDLNLADFFNLNGLTMDSRPSEGTSLKIPQTGTWNSGPKSLQTHPTDYTVRSGDTVYSIGCYFGDVNPQDIIELNGLQSPYTLTVGTVLKIP
jgi:LysM repeat protein